MSRYFLYLVLLAIILELSSGQVVVKCFGDMRQECLRSCPPPNTSRCIISQTSVQCHCIPHDPNAPTIGVGNPCQSDDPPVTCDYIG